jgi:hypothetical protein
MSQVVTRIPKDTVLNGFAHLVSGTFSTLKSNLSATTDPTVSSDAAAGYAVGSTWINTTLDKVFVCVDSSNGAAVWRSFIDPSLASNYSLATGTNTYAATLVPAISAYVNGLQLNVRFTNANTGASTLNVNSVGAKNIFKNGSALASGDIQANSLGILVFNTSDDRFDLVAGGSTSSGGGSGFDPFLFIGN